MSSAYRWNEFRAELSDFQTELTTEPEIEAIEQKVDYSSLETKLTDLRVRTKKISQREN